MPQTLLTAAGPARAPPSPRRMRPPRLDRVLLRRWFLGPRPSRALVRALVWAVVAYAIFGLCLRIVWVDGESMSPTVRTGTVHLANLLNYRFGDPRRGDIVVIRLAGRRVMYLKRVLALPGETVRFDHGVFLVDNRPLEEP